MHLLFKGVGGVSLIGAAVFRAVTGVKMELNGQGT